MSSVLIAMVCDADLCAQYKKMQELREFLTVGDCERLYEYAITESPNEEDLSALTFDQIISKGEEVYQRWEDLRDMSDPEKFCEECEHRYTVREREEYWGSICYREFETCKAEFDPDSSDCPYSDDFEAYVQERRECEAILERLDALQEKLEEEAT
jgi:hypothetical protein